jgi:hypothetical protein
MQKRNPGGYIAWMKGRRNAHRYNLDKRLIKQESEK